MAHCEYTLDYWPHLISWYHVDLWTTMKCTFLAAVVLFILCPCCLCFWACGCSAVIVTCCIAKLTQGGLLYGGDRPGRCSKPCKHSTDHCHSEGLDCGYNWIQPRPPSWWGVLFLCLASHHKSWNYIQNLLFTSFYSFCKSFHGSTLTSLFFFFFFLNLNKRNECHHEADRSSD